MGISVPTEYGGQGLPGTMTVMINELMCGASIAFSMYPGLTQGAIAALPASRHAGAEGSSICRTMTSGKWTGTHEPHRAALRHGPGPARAPRR